MYGQSMLNTYHTIKDLNGNGKVDGADGLSTCFPYLRNVEGLDEYLTMIKENTFDLQNYSFLVYYLCY